MGTSSLALLLALSLGSAAEEAALPPLDDLWRFPRQSVCQAWVEFGTAHDRWLMSRYYDFISNPAWSGLIWDYDMQVCRRTQAWKELEHAWEEKNETAYRRQCLQRLRAIIGEQAYFCGYVPVVPDLRYFHIEE